MKESVNSKYIIRDNRIFLDICEEGCGSNCAYCYVQDKNKPQVLLSQKQILLICNMVKDKVDTNTIISLCPNTEPFKSIESTQLILFIIRFFLPLGCYIQISTKEKIPEMFLKEISYIHESRIFINISMPYIIGAERIEPKAAPVNDRLENFKRIQSYPGVHCCLYIKPFQVKDDEEQKLYIQYIKEYNISVVCVGPQFNVKIELPCTSLHDRVIAKKLMEEQSERINDFIITLREYTSARVYTSSICCIYSEIHKKCKMELYQYNEIMCKDCNLRRK